MSALHGLWERVFGASMLQWLGAGAGTGGTPDVAGPEVEARGHDEARVCLSEREREIEIAHPDVELDVAVS
jgi:hypothetical protein